MTLDIEMKANGGPEGDDGENGSTMPPAVVDGDDEGLSILDVPAAQRELIAIAAMGVPVSLTGMIQVFVHVNLCMRFVLSLQSFPSTACR